VRRHDNQVATEPFGHVDDGFSSVVSPHDQLTDCIDAAINESRGDVS
jgi:hypothetical protein